MNLLFIVVSTIKSDATTWEQPLSHHNMQPEGRPKLKVINQYITVTRSDVSNVSSYLLMNSTIYFFQLNVYRVQ